MEVLGRLEARVLSDAAAWVVMNGDAATLPAQLAAAQSAGVSRVFVHLCAVVDAATMRHPASRRACAPECALTVPAWRVQTLLYKHAYIYSPVCMRAAADFAKSAIWRRGWA